MSVQTTSELMNLSSTLNSTLELNAIHSNKTETTTNSSSYITKCLLQLTNTIGSLLLFQEVPNETPLLRTHDQEIARSSRQRAAKLLCNQRLSQWTVAENNYSLSTRCGH